jgi:hypothetical protein
MNANLSVTGHHDLEHAGGGHEITGRITVTGEKTNASPDTMGAMHAGAGKACAQGGRRRVGMILYELDRENAGS